MHQAQPKIQCSRSPKAPLSSLDFISPKGNLQPGFLVWFLASLRAWGLVLALCWGRVSPERDHTAPRVRDVVPGTKPWEPTCEAHAQPTEFSLNLIGFWPHPARASFWFRDHSGQALGGSLGCQGSNHVQGKCPVPRALAPAPSLILISVFLIPHPADLVPVGLVSGLQPAVLWGSWILGLELRTATCQARALTLFYLPASLRPLAAVHASPAPTTSNSLALSANVSLVHPSTQRTPSLHVILKAATLFALP